MSLPDGNTGGNRATLTGAGEDLASGVYRRGSRWVAVYREDGRQRKQSASTFREAREIKIRRTAEEASRRAGRTLHSYALEWVDHYAGRGANGVINDRTRREYRRLLIKYALAYFATDTLLRDIDEHGARGFVEWLCRRSDEGGHRLCDRSVRNAVLPLQSCLWAPRDAVCSGSKRSRCCCCRVAAGAEDTSSTSVASSRASSSRDCSLRCQMGGGRSSICSRRPVCGSLRRSRYASSMSTWIRLSRGSTCGARS